MGKKLGFLFILIAVLIVSACYLYGRFRDDAYRSYLIEDKKANQRFGDIVFREVSPFGLVTVGQMQHDKIMFINYREMCSASDRKKSIIASNILSDETVHHVEQGDILNIGLGCGLTAAHVAKYPHVHHLDVLEINPVIYKAMKETFAEENDHLADNPKVDIIIQDGVDYIRDADKKYDAIVVDIEEVSVIYSSPLYTREYLQIMKEKLNKDGMVSMWSFLVNDEFQKTLYNTFKAVFPYVRLQFFEGSFNIYGSDKPITLRYTPNVELSDQQEEKIVTMKDVPHINTQDQRMLERFYNSNKNFKLPADYTEEFVR